MMLLAVLKEKEPFAAMLVEADNLDGAARWCNGSIKGTLLPPDQQEIEFHRFGNEERVAVGDYLIRINGAFFAFKPEQYAELFDTLETFVQVSRPLRPRNP